MFWAGSTDLKLIRLTPLGINEIRSLALLSVSNTINACVT